MSCETRYDHRQARAYCVAGHEHEEHEVSPCSTPGCSSLLCETTAIRCVEGCNREICAACCNNGLCVDLDDSDKLPLLQPPPMYKIRPDPPETPGVFEEKGGDSDDYSF